MNEFTRWLLGIRSSPEWVDGGRGDWRLQLQSVPEGGWAVLALVAAVLAVAGIWYLYRKEGRSLSLSARLLLATLRSLVLVGMAFMLLELVLVITKRELVPSRLLLLTDTSQSMSLADPYPDESIAREMAQRVGLMTPEGQPDVVQLRQRSRLELAQGVMGPLLDDLARGRVVSSYGFAGKLEPLPPEQSPSELRATGTVTGLGDALVAALAAHRGQPLVGIVAITDGRSNSGQDPRQAAVQAGQENVPVFLLAAGTAEGPRNVRLADLEASPVVFLRDPVEISALVESRGLKDSVASVVLEQRLDDGSWKEVAREQVLLGEDAVLKRATFRITPGALGQIDFRARAEDVGPELTDADNAATASVKVVRERIRVLLLAGCPGPEVQFLRNTLLRDTQLEFASWLQTAGEGYEHVGHRPIRRLPANQQELDRYDVVILFDPDMRGLGPAWPEMLTRFVGDAGGGLIYIASELHSQNLFSPRSGDGSTLGIGGGDSSWLRILPVVRDPGLFQTAAEVRLSSRDTWRLELSPEGAADQIFQFAAEPDRNREVLASLPGMYWHFPVTRAKPGATVLARHGDPRMRNSFGRHVLMATQLYGPGRTVFVGFDSTYRWRYLHEEYFDGFWARLIDRVGRSKVLGGRYPFTLATDKSVYRVGDRVTLRAELLDTSDAASVISELRGDVDWGGESALPISLEPLAEEPGVLEATFVAAEAGAYTVRLVPSTAADLETGMRPATLAFRVEPPHQELDNPTWDRPLLEDVARASGGAVFALTEADKLTSALGVRQVERVLEYRDEIWDAPLLCGGVLLLLTVEWLLRKRYRMA